jgi:hypothetical protein
VGNTSRTATWYKYVLSRVRPIPPDVQPNPQWGPDFDNSSGFTLDVGEKYSMSVFVDRKLKPGNHDTLAKYFSEPDRLLAHCISCVGEEWTVYTESTETDEFGLLVYTARGKALAAGTGWIAPNGEMSSTVSTLYRGITQRIGVDYTATAGYNSQGQWTVTGGVKVSDPR